MGARMRVVSVIGTRPEAIKMAPVISALQNKSETGIETLTISTGQHQEMVQPIFDFFRIRPDFELGLMKKCHSLNALFSAAIAGMDDVFADVRPDMVLVHGDTTTAAAAALAAFHRKIKVAHVEAGLRSGNLGAPWPEEWNRRVITLSSGLHFAPTPGARRRLIAEGIAADRVVVTGNTVVDALLTAAARLRKDDVLRSELDSRFSYLESVREIILVTTHRRENAGAGIDNICRAILSLSERPGAAIVFPVHLNPQVRVPVLQRLGGRRNIHLIPPADYVSFVYLMLRSSLILTDSGGVQEEAPSLGKPVLVMRDVTERPEAVASGAAHLVGTETARIIAAASKILDAPDTTRSMPNAANPFGDGRAAERIVQALVSDQVRSASPFVQRRNAKAAPSVWTGRGAHRVPLQSLARRGQNVSVSA